ncbi:hypothetical protein PILCRDRAFT_823728 [Piloderma croceum F 1598]|uniref:Glycopeptide n=1 Tax=Piloderma croceum (strain F 1598) TaxID=765440 RepID=A0A0C3FHV0_PILCF|nr:hypothetical protein PILCRDRAFT_823728 [Piloderma croceum F 1598]
MVRLSTSIFTVLSILCTTASAGHSISVNNQCGYGTPTLSAPFTNGQPTNIAGGYSSSGDLTGFIIYLQNGNQCGANGENCLILEGTLNNGYSSVDISKIPPHSFNSPLAFSYTNGAGGRSCNSASCQCDYAAFCKTDDYGAQVGSPDPNASITVTFC